MEHLHISMLKRIYLLVCKHVKLITRPMYNECIYIFVIGGGVQNK